jgi:hypothetical protein
MEHTELPVEACEMCGERRGDDQLMVGCACCFFELVRLRTTQGHLQLQLHRIYGQRHACLSSVQREAFQMGLSNGFWEGAVLTLLTMAAVALLTIP